MKWGAPDTYGLPRAPLFGLPTCLRLNLTQHITSWGPIPQFRLEVSRPPVGTLRPARHAPPPPGARDRTGDEVADFVLEDLPPRVVARPAAPTTDEDADLCGRQAIAWPRGACTRVRGTPRGHRLASTRPDRPTASRHPRRVRRHAAGRPVAADLCPTAPRRAEPRHLDRGGDTPASRQLRRRTECLASFVRPGVTPAGTSGTAALRETAIPKAGRFRAVCGLGLRALDRHVRSERPDCGFASFISDESRGGRRSGCHATRSKSGGTLKLLLT